MDQNKFLKQMQELVEFGRTKDNVLTKEEIADYCSDMSLTDKQLELVYAKNTRSMSLVIRQAMMTRKKKARKAKKRQTPSISAFISRS